MKITTRIFLMMDSHGNKTSVTVYDLSDTVQICGLKNKEGKRAYFDNDAYFIPTFCKANGVELKVIDREEDFDTLWASH